MKRTSTLLLPFLLLAACAPARPAAPAPVPDPESTTATTPAQPPAAPVAAPASGSEPPAAWWLMSTDATGAYGASVARAYGELLTGRSPQRTVVVAVIDSGVDVEHDDLDGNIWVNEDEIPANGKDDDANGYVDDVHGWNFIGGKDGRNVDEDTFEVTRLYAACQQRAAGGSPAYSPPPAECPAIEAAFQERVAKYREMQAQNAAIARIVDLLRGQLDGAPVNEENVKRLRPFRNDVRQAQSVYLQIAAMGYAPEDIAAELEQIDDIVEYSLDPKFDPRPIVGDNYADPTERGYGNPDVTGPDASHGTGVAGIIAAERGNGLGEDGIAPAVRIMALRAVPNGDERDKDVANAIRYAADNGAQIVNMSFGKSHSPYKQVVDEAVKYATGKGVLLVHAAGNDAEDLDEAPNFPSARYLSGGESATWLEIGASAWKGAGSLAADFTNYGARNVDLFAPGVDIRTTDVDEDFQRNSGTSFAAPVVSGVAALVMAYYPELSAAAVRQVLLESATPLREQLVTRPGGRGRVAFGELSRTGALVNAYQALKLAGERAAASSGN